VSPAKRRSMMQRNHPKLSISRQCKIVSLRSSAFYYTPVGIDAAMLDMMKEIDGVFIKYPLFGSRQIAAYLRREKTLVGRPRVPVHGIGLDHDADRGRRAHLNGWARADT